MKKFETRLSSLNIVDYIYIHDIVFLNSITEEKQKLYLDFLGEISDINFERNYYGKDAELYKHLLLCSIEIIISTRQEYTDGEASLDTNDYSAIFLEKILNLAIKYDFNNVSFLADVFRLRDKFELMKLESYYGYKLVGQCLYIEYKNISIEVLKVFLNLEIVNVKKYVGNKGLIYVEDEWVGVFLRAMLFIEFEIIKKQLYIENTYKTIELNLLKNTKDIIEVNSFIDLLMKSRALMDKEYTSIAKIELGNEISFKEYLNDINIRLAHKKIFFDDMLGCIGFISSWFVSYHEKVMKEYSEEAVSDNENLKNYLNEAKLAMDRKGFRFANTITINTYYEKYNELSKLVVEWFNFFSQYQVGILTPDPATYFFLIKKEGKNPSDYL